MAKRKQSWRVDQTELTVTVRVPCPYHPDGEHDVRFTVSGRMQLLGVYSECYDRFSGDSIGALSAIAEPEVFNESCFGIIEKVKAHIIEDGPVSELAQVSAYTGKAVFEDNAGLGMLQNVALALRKQALHIRRARSRLQRKQPARVQWGQFQLTKARAKELIQRRLTNGTDQRMPVTIEDMPGVQPMLSTTPRIRYPPKWIIKVDHNYQVAVFCPGPMPRWRLYHNGVKRMAKSVYQRDESHVNDPPPPKIDTACVLCRSKATLAHRKSEKHLAHVIAALNQGLEDTAMLFCDRQALSAYSKV